MTTQENQSREDIIQALYKFVEDLSELKVDGANRQAELNGVRRSIEHLAEVVMGNGEPGLRSDVRVLLEKIERLEESYASKAELIELKVHMGNFQKVHAWILRIAAVVVAAGIISGIGVIISMASMRTPS